VFANATALKLPNADPSRVTVKYLTAPNTNEMFDVSWAGMTYKGITDGKPVPDTSGRPGVAILDCSNGCSVDVPGECLFIYVRKGCFLTQLQAQVLLSYSSALNRLLRVPRPTAPRPTVPRLVLRVPLALALPLTAPRRRPTTTTATVPTCLVPSVSSLSL
jgi:hypothetical protein